MGNEQTKHPDGVYRNVESTESSEVRLKNVEDDFKKSDFMKGVNVWKSVGK